MKFGLAPAITIIFRLPFILMYSLFNKLKLIYQDIHEIKGLTWLNVSLQIANAADDKFYHEVITAFFNEATERHPRLPFIQKFKYGFATAKLANSFDEYFMKVEAAARRNYKKAFRNDYYFKPIEFNEHIEDIQQIRTSTTVRQGTLPDSIIKDTVKPCPNPTPKSTLYGYPYFGVFNKEDKLVAYAGGILSGEILILESIYGHAKYQNDGIVPFLVINIANLLIETQKDNIKYFAYGTYYGAGETMRRFKRKLDFKPHNINWSLD